MNFKAILIKEFVTCSHQDLIDGIGPSWNRVSNFGNSIHEPPWPPNYHNPGHDGLWCKPLHLNLMNHPIPVLLANRVSDCLNVLEVQCGNTNLLCHLSNCTLELQACEFSIAAVSSQEWCLLVQLLLIEFCSDWKIKTFILIIITNNALICFLKRCHTWAWPARMLHCDALETKSIFILVYHCNFWRISYKYAGKSWKKI